MNNKKLYLTKLSIFLVRIVVSGFILAVGLIASTTFVFNFFKADDPAMSSFSYRFLDDTDHIVSEPVRFEYSGVTGLVINKGEKEVFSLRVPTLTQVECKQKYKFPDSGPALVQNDSLEMINEWRDLEIFENTNIRVTKNEVFVRDNSSEFWNPECRGLIIVVGIGYQKSLGGNNMQTLPMYQARINIQNLDEVKSIQGELLKAKEESWKIFPARDSSNSGVLSLPSGTSLDLTELNGYYKKWNTSDHILDSNTVVVKGKRFDLSLLDLSSYIQETQSIGDAFLKYYSSPTDFDVRLLGTVNVNNSFDNIAYVIKGTRLSTPHISIVMQTVDGTVDITHYKYIFHKDFNVFIEVLRNIRQGENKLFEETAIKDIAEMIKNIDWIDFTEDFPVTFNLSNKSDWGVLSKSYVFNLSSLGFNHATNPFLGSDKVKIFSKDFTVLIILAFEGNGFVDNKLIDYEKIGTTQFGEVYRIKDTNGEYVKDSFEYITKPKSNYYFYSNKINTGADCTNDSPNAICGLPILQTGDIRLFAYCGVDRAEDKTMCDKVISNITM